MSEALAFRPADGRSEQEVRGIVRVIVRELAPNPDGASIGDAQLVEDLGFHSLALLELAFALEDEFDLTPIDQQTAQQITTTKAVEDYVVEQLHRLSSPGGLR
jgi:acyl carrier protein